MVRYHDRDLITQTSLHTARWSFVNLGVVGISHLLCPSALSHSFGRHGTSPSTSAQIATEKEITLRFGFVHFHPTLSYWIPRIHLPVLVSHF